MNKKSIILLLFTMLMGVNVMAQTSSYVSTLKEFLSLSGNSNVSPDKMKSTLQVLNQAQYGQLTLAQSEKLIDEYLSTQYETDMYEKVLAPIFQRHASEEDLKKQIAALKTPAGKQYTEHLNAASTGIGMMLGLSVLTLLTDDDDSDDSDSEVECPQSYRDLFDKYYAASKTEQVMGGVMNTLVKTMSEKLDDKKMLEKFSKAMTDNLKQYSLTCFVEAMTEDDLKFGLKLFEDPAGKHIQDASIDMMSDITNLGLTAVSSYTEWLKSKGIKAQ